LLESYPYVTHLFHLSEQRYSNSIEEKSQILSMLLNQLQLFRE
jgi:hypothetical protein